MQRRQFLTRAGGAAGAALLTASSITPAPAIAQGKRELRMVTTWPRDFPGFGTGAQRLADSITVASGGRLAVKVYAAGELVPQFDAFDAVAEGRAEMMHATASFWQAKSSGFNFFSSVPFGLTAAEMSAWLRFGGGQQLWDELAAQFNVKGLPAGNAGVQMGGWFLKDIETPEDLKGLKFRMPGPGGEVLSRLGVELVTLAAAEIFPALQSGAIDGTKWFGPWNDLAFGFHKVAKLYYWPGFHEPGLMVECTFNRTLWDQLSPGDRVLIANCCAAENDRLLSEFNARNGEALDGLIRENGVQLRRFSEPLYEALARTSEEVVADLGSESELTRKIYASFFEFRRKAIGWTSLSDEGYAALRMRTLARI